MFVPILKEKQSNDTCSKWNRKLHFSQPVSNAQLQQSPNNKPSFVPTILWVTLRQSKMHFAQ